MKTLLLLLGFVVATASPASVPKDKRQATSSDPAQYVNPFIGTINGGHTFAGASLPWGAVKAVADSQSGDNQGGFVSDGSPITGISQIHDDGTGGSTSLGNFKLFPVVCSLNATASGDSSQGTICVTQEVARSSPIVENSASGNPGYFSVTLQNSSIKAEVTVTQHTAIHRFDFTKASSNNSDGPVVLVDLVNDLSHSFSNGNLQITAGSGNGTDATRVTGQGTFNPSFGIGTYKAYFCLDAPGLTQAGVYNGDSFSLDDSLSLSSSSTNAGALLQLSPDATSSPYTLRIGISWTSTDKACSYAEGEIPDITSDGFDQTQKNARATWNTALGNVEVGTDGISDDFLELFYSSYYRTLLSPYNVSGDNPLWESTEPAYDSYYCIWDSFRVVHPLLALTQPQAQAEMVRSLIDIYEHNGFMPDCRMSFDKGATQGGSNADMVLSDSFVKGIKDGIDWDKGYAAVVKDATVEPPDWTYEGRGGIKSRATLGYVPVNDTDIPSTGSPGRSASRTLEYAANDHAIALIAWGLKKTDDAQHYATVAGDWQNLWNPDTSIDGYSGFIQPRHADGSWFDVDPRYCSPVLCHDCCFLNDNGGEFYEASPYEYSFYVPQDMAKAIDLMGGKDQFLSRLDHGWDTTYIDSYDEPAFWPAYIANYAGRPDKSVDRALNLLETTFNTSINGIPGNDDSGAMAAFAFWTGVGFFPVAGQSIYLLSTPLFPSIKFTNPSTNTAFTITATNFDGAQKNKYIQSVKINGQDYTKNYIDHSIFLDNGDMEITLGSSPSSFGTQNEDVPPSLSTGGFFDGFVPPSPNGTASQPVAQLLGKPIEF